MNSIVALAIKDLRLLFRDKVGFFFTCFFPLLYCIFFGVIFSQMGKGAERVCEKPNHPGFNLWTIRLIIVK